MSDGERIQYDRHMGPCHRCGKEIPSGDVIQLRAYCIPCDQRGKDGVVIEVTWDAVAALFLIDGEGHWRDLVESLTALGYIDGADGLVRVRITREE